MRETLGFEPSRGAPAIGFVLREVFLDRALHEPEPRAQGLAASWHAHEARHDAHDARHAAHATALSARAEARGETSGASRLHAQAARARATNTLEQHPFRPISARTPLL